MEIAKELGVASLIQDGVYAMVGGPNFESIAEARLLHRLGVDAVGKTHTDTHKTDSQCEILRPQYEQTTSR